MIRNFTLLFFALLSLTSFSQNDHKYVKLNEEIIGKRYELFIENTDSISYDVFLKVDTNDFRRSSERPILQTIPGNSKKKVLTMVKLNDKPGNYTYILVVNEVSYSLEVDKDFEIIDFKLDRELKNKKVTLYTKDDCSICPDAKHILTKNKIGYTEYNLDQDTTNYNKIIKEFKAIKPKSDFNNIPILKIEDQLYNDIESLEDFIQALRDGFN
ncbi:glutaredoxin domain-containing protein [Olleya sp. YS]|uniref:glutaredoxin family protein n=1 Tax=Olleya sp. YS TaxID=3028318 RepID=UPI0024343E65|nr:glutaredoxin domain-containing protein [Olleya sp. YS]WGD34025.1 glutaredoxin domain-containing protein [Olleya sp. YS]